MAADSKPTDPYEAALADLRARRAEIDAAIETMERMRALSRPASSSQAHQKAAEVVPVGVARARTNHLPLSSPFYGKSLGEAAKLQIEIAGKPLTLREIWASLSDAGVQSMHNDPVHAVGTALTKQARAKGDVMVVGGGQWDLVRRYSEAELARIKENMGGMAGRDRPAHIAKTIQGMRAAAARGVRMGNRPKLTAELVGEFKRLVASGLSPRKACVQLGFSYGTYRNYKADIDRWQEGQQWPPAPPTAETDGWPNPPEGRVN